MGTSLWMTDVTSTRGGACPCLVVAFLHPAVKSVTPTKRTAAQHIHVDLLLSSIHAPPCLCEPSPRSLSLPLYVSHDLLEDPPQARQLSRLQPLGEDLLMAIDEPLQPLLLLSSCFREKNPVGPPVALIDAPLHEPALLEKIEDPRDVVAVLERVLTELALVYPFRNAKAREDAPLLGRHVVSVGLECPSQKVACLTVGAVQPEAERIPAPSLFSHFFPLSGSLNRPAILD